MRLWFVAFMSGLLMFSRAGIAQASPETTVKDRLDAVIRSYVAVNHFMGAVLVVKGNRVLIDRGFGLADVEWKISNSPDSVFRLASLTKQFTATLVLQLQQDGKLHLDDPISKYLSNTPKSWEMITLARLLGHTSGIPDLTGEPDFDSWAQSPHTPVEIISFFRDRPLRFRPGSKFEYSNSNFEILGAIIEQVSGKRYGDLLRERIFNPLNMKDSGLDSDELIVSHRAQGYAYKDGHLIHARSISMTVPWAAGSMYSTTADLLRWEHGLFEGSLLSQESLKLMTTPGLGNYGLGVGIYDLDGMKVVTHGGGIEGFNTRLAYMPDQKLAVIVLSNINSDSPENMWGQLLEVAMGRSVILAEECHPVPISEEDLRKLSGTYEVTPRSQFAFKADDDHLTVEEPGAHPLPVIYLGQDTGRPRFYFPAHNVTFEFVLNSLGRVDSLMVRHGDRVTVARRRQ